GGVAGEEGKTGKDLLDEAFTDKRFLPFLVEKEPSPGHSVRATEVRGRPVGLKGYELAGGGEGLPFFRRHSLTLVVPGHRLTLNRISGEVRWQKELTRTRFQALASLGRLSPATFRFEALGHLVLLPLDGR